MEKQVEYYKKRATEYELIYQKPERQIDLNKIGEYLENQFEAKRIIEIACGTGYWTEKLSLNCKSILAIDINETVIEIARKKKYPRNNVLFEKKNLMNLEKRKREFEGLFGGFIWSHIKKQDIQNFLRICFSQVSNSSEIIFIDNKFKEGSSTPIYRVDSYGNSYQKRILKSGEEYEVVKNFPSRQEFANLIGIEVSSIEWIELDYYWIAKFKKPDILVTEKIGLSTN